MLTFALSLLAEAEVVVAILSRISNTLKMKPNTGDMDLKSIISIGTLQ